MRLRVIGGVPRSLETGWCGRVTRTNFVRLRVRLRLANSLTFNHNLAYTRQLIIIKLARALDMRLNHGDLE
ncbi:MAG: hypothetical protein QOJ86_1529 [Bradyrhizobium sp.]|nr:hypothetical protein [Bradyrhizobium sp.]